jgi:hypothetical protein
VPRSFIAALKRAIADDVTIEIERAYKLAMQEVRADLAALRDAVKQLIGDDTKLITLPPLRSAGKPLN